MNNICEYCVHKGEMCMPVEYPCVDYAPRKDMKMSLEQALERNPFDEKCEHCPNLVFEIIGKTALKCKNAHICWTALEMREGDAK